MTRPPNRRLFLRGLGGACVAAPFLGSLFDRPANAQARSGPRRLIVMFTHYGCVTTRFFPAKSHGALTAADLEATTLAPLAPHADKVLIPRGIRAMNEWTPTMIRGQGNDPHTQVVGSYFTCQPVTPNGTEPFSFDQATKFNAKPVGRSLDHVIAEQLSPGGKPLLVRVGNRTDTPQSGISYSARETPYDGVGTPAEVLSGLTGLFQGGPMSPDTYQAVRGKSVIDIVRDDLDTLERSDMSQSDKMKLEAWKQLLDETTTMVRSAQCSDAGATQLKATQTDVDAFGNADSTGDVLSSKVTATADGADLYSNVAVLAAVCNANPVIFLKYPPNFLFSGLGLNVESHSVSHRVANAGMAGTCITNAIDLILTIDDFYARKFAHLVDLLDGIDEGDGKVLDNTAAVWFQELSDGNQHNLNNLPIVQVGSAGGYFKTGWAVNVEDGSADLSPGHSEDGCTNDIMDAEAGTGTNPSFANAPINKYFYNLMNALGVKAGADGFPLQGGSAEVTRFGMYDKTEDFVGGGTNPPAIHSPGEYAELKANA